MACYKHLTSTITIYDSDDDVCYMDVDAAPANEDEESLPYYLPTDTFLSVMEHYGTQATEKDLSIIMVQERYRTENGASPLVTQATEDIVQAFLHQRYSKDWKKTTLPILRAQAEIVSLLALSTPCRDSLRSFFLSLGSTGGKVWYAKYDRARKGRKNT